MWTLPRQVIEEALVEQFLYIHGFNSSPASFKAQCFIRWCEQHVPEARVHVPGLSHDPVLAMEQLEEIMREAPVTLVLGSSLGGYYATWLSEKYNVPAALINPAVRPWQLLSSEVPGTFTNYYSGQQYELTARHVESLRHFDVVRISRPELLFLLVQTADETLDYRQATEKYRDCLQDVTEGGSHAYEGFEEKLPVIMNWLKGLADIGNQDTHKD